jgi:integrase/recombinase XerD
MKKKALKGGSLEMLQQSGNMNYRYSAKVKFNRQRPQKDGSVTIYIQLLFNREKKDINLNFSWPIDKINLVDQVLAPRMRDDKACADNNIIIKNELAKINEIFRLARLANRALTMAAVLKDYEDFVSKDNFLIYAFKKIVWRESKGIIRSNTARSHKSSITTLSRFNPTFTFENIDKDFLETYKAFMYTKLKYDSDTALTKFKNIRTYMNLAKKDGFRFFYPFKGFKLPQEQERIDITKEKDLQLLKRFLKGNTLTAGTNREKSLRAYLFVCYTGVRLGDLYALQHKHIKNGSLVFIPQKKDADHQIEITIPLHSYAKSLIQTKKGALLILPPESKFREEIRWVAEHLDITDKISPHVGRHTFATRFLTAGGSLEVLQRILGHESIKTTMKYVHVTEERKRNEIDFLK